MLVLSLTADGAIRFSVRVQPRASRTEVAGLYGDALRVRVQAPPVDGAANEALSAFLAESLGVPRRDVRIVAGGTARTKVVEVLGARREAVEGLAGPRRLA
ncbi:MAG: DUF167 domain-containing protein [Gemmatimonadaceae bacterium]